MSIINSSETCMIINDTNDVLEKKINEICNSNDCINGSSINGVELKDLCDVENNYEEMKLFIEKFDVENLIQSSNNFLLNSNNIGEPESEQKNKRYELLLILKLFKKIKLMENQWHQYWLESSQYNKNIDNFKTCINQYGNIIHEFNIKPEKDKTEYEYILLLKNALSQQKMKHELLIYELINYTPTSKIYFEARYLQTIALDIKNELDRFNPIIQTYLEDDQWTINYKNTMNFAVPKNKIIYSNTISRHDASNDTVIQHMNLVTNFINNIFKISSGKFVIIDDNKYNICWILISVGYFE